MAGGGRQPQQLCPQPCAGTAGPCAQATRQVPFLFLSHVTTSPTTYGATPQDGSWPALPQSAPAHTAVTLPSYPCSHSQGCSQQRIPRELKGGSPGQGTAQGCGTRGCSGSSVVTHGSLSGATQHSHCVTPLPSSLRCVPSCHHAGCLQGCQCPPAPRCAQPCFGDSSPTTVSPRSEATTASIGAFSYSPAPTAHTGWATPLRPLTGAGLALGACGGGGATP